ncbi:hypothetical protein BDK51DRAFT_30884, partial [Blyttiomyces helicus]
MPFLRRHPLLSLFASMLLILFFGLLPLPQQALVSTIQLLTDTNLNTIQANYASTILSSGTELCRMLDNIMDAIRATDPFTSNVQSKNPESFDLKETIELVLKRLSALVPQEILLACKWDPAEPAVPRRVMGDNVSFKRVLINLVSNAIRFTERGSITVEVKYNPDGHIFYVAVIDTGTGIDPEDLPLVFQKYWKKESPIASQHGAGALGNGGSGLGLSICASIVKILGGEIGVTSSTEEGRSGSTFWFTLRLPPAPHSAASPEPTQAAVDNAGMMAQAESAMPETNVNHQVDSMVGTADERPSQWAASDEPAQAPPVAEGSTVTGTMQSMDPPVPAAVDRSPDRTPPPNAEPIAGIVEHLQRAVHASLESLPDPPSTHRDGDLQHFGTPLLGRLSAREDTLMATPSVLLISPSLKHPPPVVCTSPPENSDVSLNPSQKRTFDEARSSPTPSEGATARRRVAASGLSQPGSRKSEAWAAVLPRSLHVLVAEDNALCQKVLTKILQKLGCTVQIAADGLEALEAWQDQARPRPTPDHPATKAYDIILMDIRMPKLDGISAARMLRDRGCGVPIIAITAERGETVLQKAL